MPTSYTTSWDLTLRSRWSDPLFSTSGDDSYDPLLPATGGNPRQRFGLVSAVFALGGFATGCHWLRALGSINAPSPWREPPDDEMPSACECAVRGVNRVSRERDHQRRRWWLVTALTLLGVAGPGRQPDCEPWHRQSQLRAAPFHRMRQARCAHIAETARALPSWSRCANLCGRLGARSRLRPGACRRTA